MQRLHLVVAVRNAVLTVRCLRCHESLSVLDEKDVPAARDFCTGHRECRGLLGAGVARTPDLVGSPA